MEPRDVTVGDPYLWVTVRILKQGTYLIKPSLTTSTYDPNLAQNIGFIGFANLCAKKPGPEVNAAEKTIPMQPTGQPISALVMAILAILSGLIVSKRIKSKGKNVTPIFYLFFFKKIQY